MIFAALYADNALDYLIYVVFTLVAVVIAMVLHEYAHGLVAKWNGEYTAKYSGRLTLNPLKHFDPIGFVMMMLVGFGYAKPVPINPGNFRKFRRGLFTVSIAGICMNLILALLFALLICLMGLGMVLTDSEIGVNVMFYFARFFIVNMRLNLSLAFFNLLPIYPLDGFRIVECLTRRGNKFCAFMRTNGQYILFGLVGLHFIVSMAMNYFPQIPNWFAYIDILGTYMSYCTYYVGLGFTLFWSLMMPPLREVFNAVWILLMGSI